MVQYSNRATCQQSEKDGTLLKHSQNLSTVRKRWYNTQSQNLSPVRKRWYNTQTEQTVRKRWYNTQTEQTVRKRWYNTQTEPKAVTSLKEMVQHSNRATCQQSEKDGTILKQSQNLSTVRKRWYNTQRPKPVTSQKKI